MTKRKEYIQDEPEVIKIGAKGAFIKFRDSKLMCMKKQLLKGKNKIDEIEKKPKEIIEFRNLIDNIQPLLNIVYNFCADKKQKLSSFDVKQVLQTKKLSLVINKAQSYLNIVYSDVVRVDYKRKRNFEEKVREILDNQGGLIKYSRYLEVPLIAEYQEFPIMSPLNIRDLCDNFLRWIEPSLEEEKNKEIEDMSEILSSLSSHGSFSSSSSTISNSPSPLKRQKFSSSNSNQPGEMKRFLNSVIKAINSHLPEENRDKIDESFKECFGSILRILHEIQSLCQLYNRKLSPEQIDQLLQQDFKLKHLINKIDELTEKLSKERGSYKIEISIRYVLHRGAMCADTMSKEENFFKKIKNKEIIDQEDLHLFIENGFKLGQNIFSSLIAPENVRNSSSKPTSKVSSAKSSNSKRDMMVLD